MINQKDTSGKRTVTPFERMGFLHLWRVFVLLKDSFLIKLSIMKEQPGFLIKKEAEAKKEGRVVEPGKIIDEHIESLIAENEDLESKLAKYDIRLYDIVFNPEFLKPSDLRRFTKEWLVDVRKKTDLLEPIESLGIRIFSDNIANQPNFPGLRIEFSSKDVKDSSVKDAQLYGGWAPRNLDEPVKLGDRRPKLDHQVHGFLLTGTVDPTTSTLIHELIHRAHLEKNLHIGGIHTEVQAYLSGIFNNGTDFSPRNIIATLADKNGAYKYDKEEVRRIIRAVEALYGLGASYEDVAELLIKSEVDPAANKYPVEIAAEERLKGFGLDTVDEAALDYMYRLYITNQRLKARLLLFEKIDEKYSLDARKEVKGKLIQSMIATPPAFFGIDGKPADMVSGLKQNAVVLANKEFPYDSNGLRTGVVFGPVVIAGGQLRFGIGEFEAEGDRRSAKWANSPEEFDNYIDILSGQSSRISFPYKANLFLEYLRSGFFQLEEVRQIFDALAGEKDLKKLIKLSAKGHRESLSIMAEELKYILKKAEISSGPTDEDIRKVEVYDGWIKQYQDFKKLFDDKSKNSTSRLAEELARTIKRIKSIKDGTDLDEDLDLSEED